MIEWLVAVAVAQPTSQRPRSKGRPEDIQLRRGWGGATRSFREMHFYTRFATTGSTEWGSAARAAANKAFRKPMGPQVF